MSLRMISKKFDFDLSHCATFLCIIRQKHVFKLLHIIHEIQIFSHIQPHFYRSFSPFDLQIGKWNSNRKVTWWEANISSKDEIRARKKCWNVVLYNMLLLPIHFKYHVFFLILKKCLNYYIRALIRQKLEFLYKTLSWCYDLIPNETSFLQYTFFLLST